MRPLDLGSRCRSAGCCESPPRVLALRAKVCDSLRGCETRTMWTATMLSSSLLMMLMCGRREPPLEAARSTMVVELSGELDGADND